MSDTSRQTTVDTALTDDGSGLVLTRELARVLGEPHAGADGRHNDEPSPFHDGDLVGTVSAVCTVKGLRPDAGAAGVSAIHKGAVDGPVEVSRTGIVTDRHGDRAHHDPRDAQKLLNSEIFGNCVIADFTKKYVRAAAHERVG